MNVKQLIAKLQKYDPKMMVVVRGYEGGYDEATGANEIGLKLNYYDTKEEWYYGRHEETDNDEVSDIMAIRIV